MFIKYTLCCIYINVYTRIYTYTLSAGRVYSARFKINKIKNKKWLTYSIIKFYAKLVKEL